MTAASGTPVRPRLSAWRMAALRAALWTLVTLGPMGAVAVWIQLDAIDSQLHALAQQTKSAYVADTGEVEGIAELAVADLLTPAASSSESPSPALVVTVSLGAEEVDTGYFAVTVATTVKPEAAEPVRLYIVGVVSTAAGWAVVGPPALVAGPETEASPELGLPTAGLDDVPGLGDAVGGFLAAYLSGQGDVTRYTAPGTTVAAVSPTPFVTVEIVEAGSTPQDGERLVVVTVAGTDSTGVIQILRYSLEVADRGGRWEVTGLLPVPPLNAADSGEGR